MKTYNTKILGYETLGDFMDACKKAKANVMAVSFVGKVRNQNKEMQEMFVITYQSKNAVLI